MSFDSVPAALRDALSRRGFTQLTSVQTAVLAADDGARDLQITSQTGSGKTVALGFVLAAGLQSTPPSPLGPTTLIIAPTRDATRATQLSGSTSSVSSWDRSIVSRLIARAPSPTFTEIAERSPLSSRRPGPVATTRPRCCFSFAVSGSTMPPAVISSASSG